MVPGNRVLQEHDGRVSIPVVALFLLSIPPSNKLCTELEGRRNDTVSPWITRVAIETPAGGTAAHRHGESGCTLETFSIALVVIAIVCAG